MSAARERAGRRAARRSQPAAGEPHQASGVVEAVRGKAPEACRAHRCEKDGCSASMAGVAQNRVLIDLDCAELPQASKHCDYVLVVAGDEGAVVAPIELKSGGFKASEVKEQLQGGADQARNWIPRGERFRFVPLLAHGSGNRKPEWERLRRSKIRFCGQERQIIPMRCRAPLADALAQADRSPIVC